MEDSNVKKHGMPWYTISLLLTILGAISIIMLFVVYFFNEKGIVFWSIIISWVVILLVALMEISRLERLRRNLQVEKDRRIAELEEALSEKNK